MRCALALPLVLTVACAATIHPPALPVPPPPPPPAVHGFTLQEEARVLQLEDRREFDAALADQWIRNPNSLHRARMALALGRIGAATFVDANHNGEKDADEKQAGVDLLASLVNDPDPGVRETAAFALGQTGDAAAVDPLLILAQDHDNAGVAAEAVEALSRLAGKVSLAQYVPLTANEIPEGVRARAIRFVFRFKSDEASAIAAAALESQSPLIRQEGAFALSRRGFAPAREKLELLASDPDPSTRTYAAAALGRIAARESLPVLIAMIGDPYPWVRTNALVSLTRLAAKDHGNLERREINSDVASLIALTDDADPGSRASAVDALGWYAGQNARARKRMIEIATSGSRWDRELAAGALARELTDPADVPASLSSWAKVRVLEAKTNGLTWRAALAIDPDPMVRASVVGAIPDDGVDAEADLINAALEDPDIIVRANAIDRYALTKTRQRDVLMAAETRGRRDPANDARLSAIQALGSVDDPQREPFLRTLLTDGDPVVRRIAADLIEEKVKKPRPQYTPLPVEHPLAYYAEIAEWSRHQHTATIHMTRGEIEIALLADQAPMTCWNFAQLARRHYFDGTSFMRVVPNFVIQGGDPRNDMNGGPGYAIRDEINMQKYTRGAVGMALSGPDTGGSQFFITHSPQPHLDGGYTIFGRAYDGMNGVVDQTERGDRVDTITIDERQATATRAPQAGTSR